jgi:hypothetical protein
MYLAPLSLALLVAATSTSAPTSTSTSTSTSNSTSTSSATPTSTSTPTPTPTSPGEAAHPERSPGAALDIGAFMAGYARTPAPGRLGELVVEADRQQLVNEDTAGPLAAFLGAAFRLAPDAIAGAARAAAAASGQAEALLWQGVWLAGTPQAAAALWTATSERPEVRATLDSLREQPAPILLLLPLEAPGVLDLLWSSWLASGDARYVVRVATALPMVDDAAPERQAVAAAARWSLRANAADDARVRTALEEAAAAGGRGADPKRLRALLADKAPVGPPGRE